MGKSLILVVEDEKDVREGIVELLKKENDVLEAANGKEAIDIVKDRGFNIDIVLLDIVLPDINGIEVLKKIRAISTHLDIIMVTVLKDIPTAVTALREGAFDYITKPFIPEDLLATIKRIEEKKEVERQFEIAQERSERMNLDFKRREILFRELVMKRKLEGKDVPFSEYIKMMHPAHEERLEATSFEEWEKELRQEIKTPPAEEEFPKPTILVVEDEADVREGIIEVLKKTYDVVSAGRADEAVSELKKKKTDVVLLDIILPDRSGVDLVPKIKELNYEARIIMETVLKDVPTAISAMKQGAYDYVTKPFIVEDLLATIERALAVSRTKARLEHMLEQLEKERFSEDLRKKLFKELLEKRKAEGKELLMDDIYAFFPDLRGKWADEKWEYPIETIEEIGIDEMVRRFKEAKEEWEKKAGGSSPL